MSNFSVGDRVQWIDQDTDELTGGTIDSIIPPKRTKTSDWWDSSKYSAADAEAMITYAHVKWDDNTDDAVDIDDLDPEDSKVEREFRLKSKEISEEINKKLSDASSALSEAVKLAEKHGIPFRSHISFLSQGYSPTTVRSIYPELDKSFVEEITGVYNEYDSEGWEHSAVCY